MRSSQHWKTIYVCCSRARARSGLESPKNLLAPKSCFVYIESRLNKDFNVFADIIIKLCLLGSTLPRPLICQCNNTTVECFRTEVSTVCEVTEPAIITGSPSSAWEFNHFRVVSMHNPQFGLNIKDLQFFVSPSRNEKITLKPLNEKKPRKWNVTEDS